MPKLKVDGVEIRLKLVAALRRMMPTGARRAAMLRIKIARIGIGQPRMEAAR